MTYVSRRPEHRPYQRKIIARGAAVLAERGNGQLHMCCASGKTITAEQICESILDQDGGLVTWTVPSIGLAAQALESWMELLGPRLNALVVCGDETSIDAPVRPEQLPVAATTDPVQIADWLRDHQEGYRLVPCTNASSWRLAEALRATKPADMAVFDEAHHFAGYADSPTRRVLDPEYFPATRRLFLTATPRYRFRSTDAPTVGMEDHDVFGPVLGSYSFAQGVKDGYLRDWILAIMCVRDSDARAALSAENVTYVGENPELPLALAAAQIALARAREQFGVGSVLSFHPKVRHAQLFTDTLPETVARIAPELARNLYAGHVNGKMTQRRRAVVLDALARRREGWAVVSSAKCLSEGLHLDHPIDGICFTYAKESEVEIIQAIGRGLRKHVGSSGPCVIILPHIVYDDDAEFDYINPGALEPTLNVIAALSAHDERFAAAIDTHIKGVETGTGVLPDKITIRLAEGLDERFLRALSLRIVRNGIAEAWWEGYSAAVEYHTTHGDLLAPNDYVAPNGFPLGMWLKRQRSRGIRSHPAARYRELLDAIGMVWNVDQARFDENLAAARAYRDEHGHLEVPKIYVDANGRRLGAWIAAQRTERNRGRLAADRVATLEGLGIDWAPQHTAWQRGYERLVAYHQQHGTADVPTPYTTDDGYKLGAWAMQQRIRERDGKLREPEHAALEGLGFSWTLRPDSETTWTTYFTEATAYHSAHGDLEVPSKYISSAGVGLGNWIQYMRAIRAGKARGRLTEAQIALLDGLGMRWQGRRKTASTPRPQQADPPRPHSLPTAKAWQQRLPLFIAPPAPIAPYAEPPAPWLNPSSEPPADAGQRCPAP